MQTAYHMNKITERGGLRELCIVLCHTYLQGWKSDNLGLLMFFHWWWKCKACCYKLHLFLRFSTQSWNHHYWKMFWSVWLIFLSEKKNQTYDTLVFSEYNWLYSSKYKYLFICKLCKLKCKIRSTTLINVFKLSHKNIVSDIWK